MRNTKTWLGALAAVGTVPAMAVAGDISPWTPIAGSTEIEVGISRQEADEFFAGDMRAALPTELSQDTVSISVAYGINDRFTIDFDIGYAESEFLTDPGLAPEGGLDGLTDVVLGVRYKALDQFDGAPVTLTLGAAAIIEGGYDTGALPAIGDGASGLQLAAALGRQFGRFSISGDVGYRTRNHDVPDEWFGAINASVAVASRVVLYGGLSTVESDGDLDIGGPGFSPARFPEVDEDLSIWSFGAAVGVSDRTTVNLAYGETFDGSNTSKSSIVNLLVGYSF
jgi:hypothetical protein